MSLLIRWVALILMAAFAASVFADSKLYRVAVVAQSPPLSYADATGQLTGFNVEIARGLCEVMSAQCTLLPMTIEQIVDALASDAADFAVVGLIATPERRKRILFSKPYFHSTSIFLARPGVVVGDPISTVAVVRGSSQEKFAEGRGWKLLAVATQSEVGPKLRDRKADAALLPMLYTLSLMQDPELQAVSLRPMVIEDPLLSGPLQMGVNPRLDQLVPILDRAIDQIKRDGRYDRINSRFLPFRLQ